MSAGHGLFVAWELQRDVKIIAHFAQLLIGSNVSPLASDSTVYPDGSNVSPLASDSTVYPDGSDVSLSASGLAFFHTTPSEFQNFLLRQTFVDETIATTTNASTISMDRSLLCGSPEQLDSLVDTAFGDAGGSPAHATVLLAKNLLLLKKKSTIANDFGGAYENAPGPLSTISEPLVCSRDELLLLSALGVGSRPGRDLPRVFFFLLSKGALGCFVLSPSCHVPLSLPLVWGSRARYGYGTSVSDKEGRGDDQMRCSCLIRGHPRGGLCLPFILLCAELDPYTKRGGAAHPV